MKITIVAVGQHLPDWAQTAWDDYAKRFGPELKVSLKTVKTEPRPAKSSARLSAPALAKLLAAEHQRIAAVLPRNAWSVVLDERGQRLTTLALAQKLQHWQGVGKEVALIIGGPDGLCPELKQHAHESLRVSDLTLPHALVRVVLIEQLYRAWTVNNGHPYHRG